MALINFDRFGLKNLNKYDYILGFDLGDGESAISFLKKGQRIPDITELFVGPNGAKKMMSALVYDSDGNFKIADTANIVSLAYTGDALATNFKASPDRLKAGEPHPGSCYTKRQLMVQYVRSIMQNLMKYNSWELFNGNGLLGIGCPSSTEWLTDGKDVDYAEIIKEALNEFPLKLDVVIIPESRAALLKTYKDNATNQTLQKALKNGVVVIDHGSSTLDVTAIDFENNTQADDSITLGARLIERAMYKRIMGTGDLGKRELYFSRPWVLTDLRRAKEGFYNYPSGIQSVFVAFKEGPSHNVLVDSAFMSEVIDKETVSYASPSTGTVSGSWSGLYRDFLCKCRDNMLPKGTFKGVVLLTGGASRMGFVEDIAREVFGTEAVIKRDLDPSYCVSRGLVIGLDTDLKAMGLTADVKGKVKKEVKGIVTGYDFRDSLAHALAETIYGRADSKLNGWLYDDTTRSLAKVTEEIEKELLETPSGKECLSEVFTGQLRKLMERDGSGSIRKVVASTINGIFAAYFPARINERSINTFAISGEEWKRVITEVTEGSKISFKNSITDYLDLEGSLSKAIKDNILVGLLLLAPYLVLSVVDWLFGTDMADSIDKMMTHDRYKSYSYDERKKILDNLRSNKEKIVNGLTDTIRGNVISDSKGDKLAAKIVDSLGASIDRAVDNVSLYFTEAK